MIEEKIVNRELPHKSVQFKLLKNIEVLEIRLNDISGYWQAISIGLAEIPSKNFHKLRI